MQHQESNELSSRLTLNGLVPREGNPEPRADNRQTLRGISACEEGKDPQLAQWLGFGLGRSKSFGLCRVWLTPDTTISSVMPHMYGAIIFH